MAEQQNNADKNPSLPSYKLAKLLHDCEMEKRVLASHVEELKVQLQTANTHIKNNKEKNHELTARLQAQKTEMENLHLQIKKNDRPLHTARGDPDSSQPRANRKNPVMASRRRNSAKMFMELTDWLRKEMNESRDQLKEFLESKARIDQERLQEFQKILNSMNILKELEDLKVAYNVEKEKNLALQQELEHILKHHRQENRFHAKKALADLFLIRKLRAAIEEKQNNVPKMRPLRSPAEDSEALTLEWDIPELQKLSENAPVLDSQVCNQLTFCGASNKLHPKNKNPLMRKTLQRVLGWKKVKNDLMKPKSSGDNNSSLNVNQ